MPHSTLEARREYLREWRKNNPEIMRARGRKEYAQIKADPERMARKKARDAQHERTSEKLKETRRRYKLEHPEVYRKMARNQRLKKPWAYLWHAAKVRAAKSGLEFSITKEWMQDNWTGKCVLTGLEFIQSEGKPCARSPSLDRKDSAIGYTPDNCRFILWALNRFKNDGTDEEMREIARALVMQ